MDFFSRKTDKSSQDYRTYLTTIKLLKTIAFFKNVHLTNAIQFWQPCFFGQRTGNFLLSARNNFAEVPERTSEPYWNLLQKAQCSSQKQQDIWITVLITLPMKFCQNPQKTPRVRKKSRNYKTSKEIEASTNDPPNLLNAVLRALVKLFTEEFEKFWLKIRT